MSMLVDSSTAMNTDTPGITARLPNLLARAVNASGRSLSDIARRADMKRDSLRRSLAGQRPATLDEAIRILEASGFDGEQTFTLALLVDETFALERTGSAPGLFLGELLRRAPAEIVAELGDEIEDLKPRWATGTAKLLAKTLMQHVTELNRRGDAIGSGFPHSG